MLENVQVFNNIFIVIYDYHLNVWLFGVDVCKKKGVRIRTAHFFLSLFVDKVCVWH